jgi:hypothetical protein
VHTTPSRKNERSQPLTSLDQNMEPKCPKAAQFWPRKPTVSEINAQKGARPQGAKKDTNRQPWSPTASPMDPLQASRNTGKNARGSKNQYPGASPRTNDRDTGTRATGGGQATNSQHFGSKRRSRNVPKYYKVITNRGFRLVITCHKSWFSSCNYMENLQEVTGRSAPAGTGWPAGAHRPGGVWRAKRPRGGSFREPFSEPASLQR